MVDIDFTRKGWFMEKFDIQISSHLILRMSQYIFEFKKENIDTFFDTIDTLIYNCKKRILLTNIDITYCIYIFEKILYTEFKMNKYVKTPFEDTEVIVRFIVSLYISQVCLYDEPLSIKVWYHMYTRFRFIQYDNCENFEIRMTPFKELFMEDVFEFLSIIDYQIKCNKSEWNRTAKTLYTLDNTSKTKYLGGVLITNFEEKMKLYSIVRPTEKKINEITGCVCIPKPILFENKILRLEYFNYKDNSNENNILPLNPFTTQKIISDLEKQFETYHPFILLPEFRDIFIHLCKEKSHQEICVNKLNKKRIFDTNTILRIMEVYY